MKGFLKKTPAVLPEIYGIVSFFPWEKAIQFGVSSYRAARLFLVDMVIVIST